MLRVCFSFCVFVLVTLFSVVAGAQENSFQKTPELLALIAETRQSLESLPDIEKIPALFQLLNLELRFVDKQPARNTVQQVLKLLPSIAKESVQEQVIEAVAFAQAELGDYADSAKMLDQIVKPSVRAEKQLNVAEKIIEDIEKNRSENNEIENSFDTTDLLRKSLAGAVEAKDAGLESLVSIILGRELAKRGKIEESKSLFEKARKKAREIEEVQEQNLVALLIRSLILVGQQAEALAMIETVADEENKLQLLGAAAIVLAHKGQIAEAENIVNILKPNEMKDNIIIKTVQASVKTITVEQIFAFAKQTSSPEFREQLLQQTFYMLSENKRDDIVKDFMKHLENVSENQRVFYQLKLLTDAKKFEEAAQFIETLDVVLKPQALRHLVMIKIEQQGEVSEELLNQIYATYSDEEKKIIEQFQQETEKALKIDDPEERLQFSQQVLQQVLEYSSSRAALLDLRGVWKILEAMLETAKQLDDPLVNIELQLMIADRQTQLYDKSGAKKNLSQLQKYLDEIQDVRILKNTSRHESNQLESVVSETTTSQPILKLNSSADEIEGKNNLFQIYCSMTFLWYGLGENIEAKKSFQKAKEIADSESDVIRKVEKLLGLAQLLAQTQSD
ncbi:MAG: hypothetical protein LBI18_09775 [Planctomycetaceae bacterium]|jgi:hypothetical protein|nr:hypothetical protein [Planctomycetaceae bacterium]